VTFPLNDETDYQLCFVCGRRNHAGLHVDFSLQGERMIATYRPRAEHQGYPGLVHGGVTFAALEETIGRLGMLRRLWLMTLKMEIRYRAPFPVAEPATIEAWPVRGRGTTLEGAGTVTLENGTLVAEGKGLFGEMPASVRETAEAAIPELRTWFD
jgi:acyl-coenzyme A thioesterase PaaI-like protein